MFFERNSQSIKYRRTSKRKRTKQKQLFNKQQQQQPLLQRWYISQQQLNVNVNANLFIALKIYQWFSYEFPGIPYVI